MTKLSVNINKIATLRNARMGDNPDVTKVAIDCQEFGADGITVHPRPDERHIRLKDVYDIKKIIKTEFNIEGYPSRKFLDLVIEVKADQVTLVPDPPEAITSSAGWDTIKNLSILTDIVKELQSHKIRTSIFIGTNLEMIGAAKEIGTNRIEFYTEPYATDYQHDKENAVKPFVEAALYAQKLGIELNAGHDLSLENLNYLNQKIPFLKEVSIGHALVCDALYFGLQNTIKMYKACLLND